MNILLVQFSKEGQKMNFAKFYPSIFGSGHLFRDNPKWKGGQLIRDGRSIKLQPRQGINAQKLLYVDLLDNCFVILSTCLL